MAEYGRESKQTDSQNMTEFDTLGWFCDENNAVYPLCREGADRGRRQVPALDADYAKEIIYNASSYLMTQVQEDGRFIYGLRPQFDKEIDSYNILRHTGTIWSLICRYRIFPDDALKEKIDSTIAYMLSQIRYDDTGDFNVQDLVGAIAARANRQLSGYFFPEQAMYMANPQRILDSFMMRDDKFRVRIDDVQHNIGGFYLYLKNYDALIAAGLNPGRMDGSRDMD